MIIVRVELLSAITGKTTELARMHICNDGTGSATRGNYEGVSFIGRDTAALDRRRASKHGKVSNYPRQSVHIWNLVARMLQAMGYTQ
jgi:hypothetical protein